MEYKKCPKCSSDIEDANRFCGKCGYDFEEIAKIVNESDEPSNIVEQKDEQDSLDNNVIIDISKQNPKKINKVAIVACITILIAILIGTTVYQNSYKKKTSMENFLWLQLLFKLVQLIVLKCVELIQRYGEMQLTADGKISVLKLINNKILLTQMVLLKRWMIVRN